MARHKKRQDTCSGSREFRLQFEENEELDVRKLSRAFLALALHETARSEQQRKSGSQPVDGERDERA